MDSEVVAVKAGDFPWNTPIYIYLYRYNNRPVRFIYCTSDTEQDGKTIVWIDDVVNYNEMSQFFK
jgi:hypothetical protein